MENSNLFHQIAAGEKIPEEINVLIEIARDSRVKYEMNKDYGIIEMDRILHTPIPYPFSYGLIPQTWNEYDNDPLDVVVIASEPLRPGCLVKCRTIGMLSVDDAGERDDKILAVPLDDPYRAHIQKFEDLPVKERDDIQYFLEHYKDLEKKTVTVKSWDEAATAKRFITECVDCYKEKF
jgi:inorganic pyrophosphatase